MNAPCAPEVVPDAAAIEAFVEVVFGPLEGYVPLRALSETGTPYQKPHSDFPLTTKVAEILKRMAPRAAATSRGLYVVPGTVAAPGSAKADDIVSTAVLLIDIDKGDIASAYAHLVTHLGLPTMEVASGGTTDEGQAKMHLYWQIDVPASGSDLERIRKLREEIARKVDGDTSFNSLHQPIRVAGTIHGKRGNRNPVRLLERRPLTYTLDDLERAVSALPWLVAPPHLIATGVVKPGPSAKELATKVIHAGGAGELNRFEALSRVIGHWIRLVRIGHCTIEQAREAVCNHNAAMICPPWDDRRLSSEFDALLRRDIRQHGQMPERTVLSPDTSLVPLSEDALAASFVTQHGLDWRYVSVWGTWFRWTGRAWTADETGAIREVVRLVCRAAALGSDKANEARRTASDKTIAAVLRIAASDPAIALPTSAWDTHPMLLNTPSGVIDLETGETRGHDRDLFLTQSTTASLGNGCPRWIAFVDEITCGDAELAGYLQRLAGYVLTGSTSEQMFAFFHGAGANGKSVFIQTLVAVLGDYAATATLDTFMANHAGRHLSELAGLRAARLVVVPETEVGRTWSEARIKTVTGGEMIRANFMHRDHFEYRPQFKLLVAGNHRPALSTVGEAMRRRLHVVPFDVTFAAEARDKSLSAKLSAERDGILGWMLDGCAEWRQSGLKPPVSVLKAARDYFADEDLVGQWIDAACDEDKGVRATAQALFSSWSSWAEARGHVPGSGKTLGDALRQRGYQPGKVGRDRGWIGLRLRRAAASGEATT
ncbi:MAG: phage/plasmid primase, P4 family [Pseudomonadota bacterium]